MSAHNTKFYSPDDPVGPLTPIGAQGMIDLMGEDDGDDAEDLKLSETEGNRNGRDEKPEISKEADAKVKGQKAEKTKIDSPSEGEAGEGDELDELEEELDGDEPDETDLELVTPVRRREILAKYPNVFKDFPYLEKAYYREQKYTEVFPTIEDAKSAAEAVQDMRGFEQKLLSGDTSTILSVVKAENPEAFKVLVDNYLPTLSRVDKDAYFHVIGSVIKGTVMNMVREANSSGNDGLEKAAEHLYQFIFGTTQWTPHTPLARGKSAESEESTRAKTEQENYLRGRFETAKTDLNRKVELTFTKAIEKHIDPKGSMTDFVKKAASRQAFEKVNELLLTDTRFRTLLDKAWRKAYEAGFSDESMTQVRRIINSRAQTVLPSVIKQARNEALRGVGRSSSKSADSDSGHSASSSNRGPLRQRTDSPNRGGSNGKLEIPKGMSNKDFLMSD